MRSQYPPELIEAYINGEFTNLTSGTVYTRYDRSFNDTDKVDDSRSDIHIGIDFNVSAMSAVAGLFKEQKLYIVDEYVGLFDTPELITVLEEKYAGRRVFVYPDAAGDARKSVQADVTDIKLLRGAGFTVRTKTKNPSVQDRVNTLNTRFRSADEQTSVYVNVNRCEKLVRSLEQQAYDEKTKAPDKKNGHDNNGIDALGYLTHFLLPLTFSRKQPIKQNENKSWRY